MTQPKADEQTEMGIQTETEKAVQVAVDKDYQDTEVEEAFVFPLTEAEKAISAQQLTDLNKTVIDLEAEKKSANAGFNKDLKSYKADIDAICRKVGSGEEKVVSCVKRVHFGHRKVYFLTLDGNDELYARDMLDEERQLSLVDPPAKESLAVNSGEAQEDEFAPDCSDSDPERVTEKTLTENTSVCF